MPQDMKAGTAEDVAELVAYLAKPEAWYVTGAFDDYKPPSGHVDIFFSRAMYQYQRRHCDGLNVKCAGRVELDNSPCIVGDPRDIGVLAHRTGGGIIVRKFLKAILTLCETYARGVLSAFRHILVQ